MKQRPSQDSSASAGVCAADMVIVGAGAAGLAAAIFAGRRMPGRSIFLLDGSARPGAKILIAGGGRCNVTNRQVTLDDFNGTSPHVIRRVLGAMPADRTVEFFREIGVDLHEEENGKLFPDTNRARTVLDALLNEAARCGVRLMAGCRVAAIDPCEGSFSIATGQASLTARCVLLATGGMSLPKTGSDGAGYAMVQRLGHSIVEPVPALVPLLLDGDFHAGLSGISHDVELAVHIAARKPVRLRGAMLWTHFGVSGPVVLDASRHWHRARLEGGEVRLSVSFLPGEDFPRCRAPASGGCCRSAEGTVAQCAG